VWCESGSESLVDFRLRILREHTKFWVVGDAERFVKMKS
jgi:hypothetical protein